MNTPEVITELRDDEVFVFGSNKEGRHIAGAARVAADHFGAVWGIGEGMAGSTYAIPTMSGFTDIEFAVARFLFHASVNGSKRFLVTKIGTGIAGYTIAEIAPLFVDAPPNVILPVEFEEFVK